MGTPIRPLQGPEQFPTLWSHIPDIELPRTRVPAKVGEDGSMRCEGVGSAKLQLLDAVQPPRATHLRRTRPYQARDIGPHLRSLSGILVPWIPKK